MQRSRLNLAKRHHVDVAEREPPKSFTAEPICLLRGCELPVEPGLCPKTGGPRCACSLTHYRLWKANQRDGNALDQLLLQLSEGELDALVAAETQQTQRDDPACATSAEEHDPRRHDRYRRTHAATHKGREMFPIDRD